MSRALLLAVMSALGASPAVAAGSSNAVPLFAGAAQIGIDDLTRQLVRYLKTDGRR